MAESVKHEFFATVAKNTLLKKQREKTKKPYNEEGLLKQFTRIPIEDGDMVFRDSRGEVLARRFQLSTDLVDVLATSFDALPKQKWAKAGDYSGHEGDRGQHLTRHYETWKQYVLQLRHSKDFLDDLPYSQAFLDANLDLFNLIEEKVKATNYKWWEVLDSIHPPPELGRLGGLFCGMALNYEVQTGRHKDKLNSIDAPDCVIPFGQFTGGELILWNLKAIVEVPPGWAIMFLGSIIEHSNMPYQGSRHSIDLHTHETVVTWWKERRAELTLEKGTDERKVTKARKLLAEKAKNRMKAKKARARKKLSAKAQWKERKEKRVRQQAAWVRLCEEMNRREAEEAPIGDLNFGSEDEEDEEEGEDGEEDDDEDVGEVD